MIDQTESILLPSRSKLEERSQYFDEFKKFLDDSMTDSWYSRAEGRALRMLVHQLGGSVKLDISGDPTPPNFLHLGLGATVAVSDQLMDWPQAPVPARTLAKAPEALGLLAELKGLWQSGRVSEVESIMLSERLTNLLEELT